MLTPIFTKLFNVILDSGIYPSVWSVGKIVPIFKNKGDSKDPQNYRPITLSSCLGKVFSLVLNERLVTFLTETQTLKENQGAFMPGTSTTKQIFNLYCLIEQMKLQKKNLFCAFIDLSNAYDKVWRNGMFSKLIDNGIDGNFLNIVKSMYNDTKAYLRYCNMNSEPFACTIGIKQGCNLSLSQTENLEEEEAPDRADETTFPASPGPGVQTVH